MQRNPAGPIQNKNPGFVLILVLVLLALVTILVTVTTITARIERRSSWNAARIELARQNALFALNVALGQLQHAVGPDQRVTARADILSSGTSINQPFWTGVWQTHNPASGALENLDVDANGNTSTGALRPWSTGAGAGTAALANGTNMVWLVSGGTNNATINPTVAFTSANSIVLAKNLNAASVYSGSTGTLAVSAPLVPLWGATVGGVTVASSTSGKYAYWVSDEGIKAKATIQDPTLNTSGNLSYVHNQSHFLASQANMMGNTLPVISGSDTRADPASTKITTVQSLSLLPSLSGSSLSGTGASAYSPDVTTYSKGVLSDVRNGGLKRDLTAAFETDAVVNPSNQYQNLLACGGGGQNGDNVYRSANSNLAVPVVTAAPLAGTTTIDGLRWESLYQYYNLYKTTRPMWRTTGTSPAAADPAGVPASALGLTATSYSVTTIYSGYSDGGGSSFSMDPIAPRVLEARVDIGLCSFVDPTSGLYRLRLRYYPFLVLYNPYGVTISGTQNTNYNYYTNSIGWPTVISVNGMQVPPFVTTSGTLTTNYLVQGSGYPLTVAALPADAASFAPGEIKAFALPADVPETTLGDPSSTNVCNLEHLASANPNMSADYAQTYDLSWSGTSDPTATVSVSVSNRGVGGNVFYENGNPLEGWPDYLEGGVGNNRIMAMNAPSGTPAGTWPNPAISTMTGEGYRLVGFNLRSKGILATSNTNYINYNYVTAPFMGNTDSFSDLHAGAWKEMYVRDFQPYTSVTEVSLDGPPSGQPHHTSWGAQSIGDSPVTPTNSRIVLQDVPCQPMLSLGQFSHVSSFYYNTSGTWGALDFASMFVGGSYASPDIPLNQNTLQRGNSMYFDNSFMANQVLFDSYYLSTVPAAYQPSADLAKYPMASGSLTTAIQNNQSLPNNRMRFYYKNGVAPSIANLRDLQMAAASLTVDGAFNVNSTSAAAWEALLSSLSGNPLTVWNYSASSPFTFTSANLSNPIPRFWNVTEDGTANQAWEGMRTLSNAQVAGLAAQVVQQVRTRGPFLSMGDFLNRRLGAKGPLTEMGALQAAIESSTNPDINAAAKAAGTATVLPSAYTTGTTYAPTNSATGIPGYLMQQDIVQAFAPVMTVRSDTFTVRCYGEADNQKSGGTEGRAWCEAVVQRVPDYLDQTDPALTATNAYTSPAVQYAPASLGDATPVYDQITNPGTPNPIVDTTNQVLGRRFKVISFRWLNESDL